MNSKELKRWLEKQGAKFGPQHGSHLTVTLNGKKTSLPMHGKREIPKGTQQAILKALGLK